MYHMDGVHSLFRPFCFVNRFTLSLFRPPLCFPTALSISPLLYHCSSLSAYLLLESILNRTWFCWPNLLLLTKLTTTDRAYPTQSAADYLTAADRTHCSWLCMPLLSLLVIAWSRTRRIEVLHQRQDKARGLRQG